MGLSLLLALEAVAAEPSAPLSLQVIALATIADPARIGRGRIESAPVTMTVN